MSETEEMNANEREMNANLIRPGNYRHHRTGDTYVCMGVVQVRGFGRWQPMVLYQHGRGDFQARSLESFRASFSRLGDAPCHD